MSSQSSVISELQSPKQSYPVSNTWIVRRALRKGMKASNELKYGFRLPDVDRLITTGQHVEGVRQDFVLHATKPASHF